MTQPQPSSLPEPSSSHLPRWRGFNLLEMFRKEEAKPFRETDFKIISEWGFNFVRLPMDYRIWLLDGGKIDDDALIALLVGFVCVLVSCIQPAVVAHPPARSTVGRRNAAVVLAGEFRTGRGSVWSREVCAPGRAEKQVRSC